MCREANALGVPPETGSGIWRMVVRRSIEIRAPSAMGVQYSKAVANLFYDEPQTVAHDDAKAGAAVAVQSFGDFQNFNPHLHVLATDGCFYGNGSFKACPTPQAKDLEEPFRHEVFKMLKAEGKINDVVIENMMNWPPARRA